MSDKTILVIDDSATIRKLVDTQLSPLGYRVVLAANAADGLRLAGEVRPDAILLDHQLPGTTGCEVCRQFADSSDLQNIPVVVSSTLRNRAYVEYSDLPNVVDMLPKPYAAELLITTVSNALETGAMVVQSQSQGTAVPEVIHEVNDTDLHGKFSAFGLREVLDFLNNGEKTGMLEVESGRTRVWFYLAKGRIQGVAANGIDHDRLLQFLPASLRDLAPVLNITSGGGSCTQTDGLVQLLDRKVLDPRLLGKLLRYQAAMFVFHCFTHERTGFQFEAGKPAPPLYRRLPLEISLLALLVDGATQCDEGQLPPDDAETVYVRRAIRGQNLDRTGLSARHMKLLALLSEPRSSEQLASQMGWDRDEVRRVVFGLLLAELAERQAKSKSRNVIAFETNPVVAQRLRDRLAGAEGRLVGKVVRDRLALQLVLRRVSPDAILFSRDASESCKLMAELFRSHNGNLAHTKWIAITSADGQPGEIGGSLPFQPHATIDHAFTAEQLVAKLDELNRAECHSVPDGFVETSNCQLQGAT